MFGKFNSREMSKRVSTPCVSEALHFKVETLKGNSKTLIAHRVNQESSVHLTGLEEQLTPELSTKHFELYSFPCQCQNESTHTHTPKKAKNINSILFGR